jgi:anaerobic magnesium-protoporphyrin IX monomethyl ester cyclase
VKANFRISSLSPKGLTKGQLGLMERAGVTSLVITPETACDATLAALRKGFTEQEIHQAADLFAGSSIKALWCFLMGGPAEDEKTLGCTIDFINRKIARKDSAFITTGIRIFPRTDLHKLAMSEGVVNASDHLLMPTFYFSPRLPPQKARELLQLKLSDLSRCIFLSDTQKSSLSTLRRLATMLRVPGPFWQYAGYMNRINVRSGVLSRNWSR